MDEETLSLGQGSMLENKLFSLGEREGKLGKMAVGGCLVLPASSRDPSMKQQELGLVGHGGTSTSTPAGLHSVLRLTSSRFAAGQ